MATHKTTKTDTSLEGRAISSFKDYLNGLLNQQLQYQVPDRIDLCLAKLPESDTEPTTETHWAGVDQDGSLITPTKLNSFPIIRLLKGPTNKVRPTKGDKKPRVYVQDALNEELIDRGLAIDTIVYGNEIKVMLLTSPEAIKEWLEEKDDLLKTEQQRKVPKRKPRKQYKVEKADDGLGDWITV